MDKLNNSEDAKRFLKELGLHIDEAVVRQVVNVLSGKVRQSLYSLYTTRSDKPPPACGKGTVDKIKKLYDECELQPYLDYLSDSLTIGEAKTEQIKEAEVLARLQPKERQSGHEEQEEFVPLLQKWRDRVQFVSVGALLRMYWQESLQTDTLRQASESQQVTKAYDNAQRRHAQSIQGPVIVLLGLEQDGLFLQLRQCYPDDSVWKAQDYWGLAYGAYLDAFHYWCAGVKLDIEDIMDVAVSEGLRQGNHNTGVDKKDFGWLKKQDANWIVFPALVGKVVSCDLLRLGINELEPNPCWFFTLDELRDLRDESITQGTKVLQSFLMTQNDFDSLAPALWEHQAKTKEDTKNLLHSLQALQAAQDDVQSKLTALQSRLCGGSS